jgi:hypothetical protein
MVWTAALTGRLIELRGDGISNAEIAATLKRPLEQVEQQISKLIPTSRPQTPSR